MGALLRSARHHRKRRLRPRQRLHLRLLIHTIDNGRLGRVHLQADDVVTLLHELWIVGERGPVLAVRLQLERSCRVISSIVSGQLISRTGRYRLFPILGTGFMSAGFFLFTFISATTPIWFLMTAMLLVGLGLGQPMQTLTIAGQNAVGARDIGVATSSSTFFRQIGGTLGVAVIFSALFSRIPETIKNACSDSTLLGTLKTADPRLAALFLNGFANATVTVFWVCLVIVLIAFVLSFFLKATSLRQTSALQEFSDDDAALLAIRAAEMVGAPLEPNVSTSEEKNFGDGRTGS